MASINTLKGYGKVSHVEDHSILHNKPQKRKFIFIIIPTVIISTILFFIAAVTIIHTTTTNSNQANISNSITAVCTPTPHPNTCISSLRNSTTADPEQLFKLSLKLSFNSLKNLSSLPTKLLKKVNAARVQSALLDCESLFTDAVDGVNSSIALMRVGKGEKMLTVEKINDIKTWVSGAMTNLETCLDGLDEMESGLHDVMEGGMSGCKEYLSNSLSIVGMLDTVLDQLHITMH